MQSRVLRELEEAGSESITTIVNTVEEVSFPVASQEFLLEVEQAIRDLYDRGFVAFEREVYDARSGRSNFFPADLQQVFPLRRCLIFDEERQYWAWNEPDCGEGRIKLVLTSEGALT